MSFLNKLYLQNGFGQNLDSELLRSFSLFHQPEVVREGYDYHLELNKYGKIVQKKLINVSLGKKSLSGFDGFLLYKYISDQQIAFVQEELKKNIQTKIYILANKLIDIEYLLKELEKASIEKNKICLLLIEKFENSPGLIYNLNEIEFFLKKNQGYEFISVLESKSLSLDGVEKKNPLFDNFLITGLVKLLVAPFEQIEALHDRMKVSKFVWIKRFHELILFILHLRIPIMSIYYFFKPLINRVLLKIEIFISFKLKGIAMWFYFRGRDLVLIIWLRSRDLVLLIWFKFLTVFEVICFRSIQFFHFVAPFFTRVLLFPFKKIYWTLEYQYQKRVKNNDK